LGPIFPGQYQAEVPGAYGLSDRFESNWSYQFQPELIKMRSHTWDQDRLRGQLWRGNPSTWPDHWPRYAWSEQQQLAGYEAYLDAKRYAPRKFDHPATTQPGYGTLVLRWATPPQDALSPQLGLLFQAGNPTFLRVYRGSSRRFHQLAPGTYRYLGWRSDSTYFTLDSLQVQADGTVYYHWDSLVWQTADSLKQVMYDDAARSWFNDRQADTLRQRIKEVAYEAYHLNQQGAFDLKVRGRVTDQAGEPLEGGTVLVKGTQRGTFTDAEGDFQLAVPPKAVLVVSYIGYQTQELFLGQIPSVIQLVASLSSLEEVVIVGHHGTHIKRNLTASISRVQTNGLAGRVAGVMANSASALGKNPLQIEGLSSLEAPEQALIVVDGVVVKDLSFLQPHQIKETQVLDAANATALYGSRAVNGIILITTQHDAAVPPGEMLADLQAAEIPLADRLQAPASLRSNFQDAAYWQPALRTDDRGEARFEVTFPDDITRWEQFGLVYDAKGRRTGQAQSSLRSYQALMAQLSLPRFLVAGDEATAFGKARNLTGDSLLARLSFSSPDTTFSQRDLRLGPAALDTLRLMAPAGRDSLRLTFRLDLPASEYFDGEQRDIPLFPQGDQATDGYFWLLAGDSSVDVDLPPGELHVRAQGSLLEVCLDEIEQVRAYRYLCNEQVASKLKTLLMAQRIRTQLQQPFQHEGDINSLIRHLMKGRNEDQLWGWWAGNATSYWISTHVVEALLEARLMGYAVDLDLMVLGQALVFELNRSQYAHQQVDLLWLLHRLQQPVSFPPFIAAAEADTLLSLTDHLRLQRLRQELDLPYQLDTLRHYQQATLRRGLYWGGKDRDLRYSSIEATLQAYDLLRRDGGHQTDLLRIQAWLLDQRKPWGWRNTYQSVRILETLLPALITEEGELPQPSQLIIQGRTRRDTIRTFPYEATWTDEPILRVEQVGKLPVYASVYRQYFDPRPVVVDSLFALRSWWNEEESPDTALQAGQPATLYVEVKVSQDAEYVLIEVPIPAGCSYAEQGRGWGPHEVYREQRRDRVAICCRRLPAGTYRYAVKLQPRFPGRYYLNPARVEEMYFPVFFGRNAIKQVGIE
jgi:TonB-dependent SusC/RagA subfamily outer membrane receptor